MTSIWRWFFYILLPLVVLLLLAVWRRTSEYGITERRYFVIVLGLWLAGIALYFIISKAKSIKIVPLTLCIVVLAVSFGPWGAFNVSEWNQVNRLKEVLIKNAILIDGKVKKIQKEIPFEDAKRISSVVRYLSEVHGFGSIQPWFEVKLDTLMSYGYGSKYYRKQESAVLVVQMFGIRYVPEWESNDSTRNPLNFRFNVKNPFVMETKQYRYVISNVVLNSYVDTQKVYIDKKEWAIIHSPDSCSLVFIPNHDQSSGFSLDLRPFASKLYKEYGKQQYDNNLVPKDSMTITITNKNTQMTLFFDAFGILVYFPNKIKSTNATMDILIKP